MAPERPLPNRHHPSGFRTRLTPAPLPQAALDAAQRLACLRLIRSDNVGPVTFRELINHFGGAGPALDALPELSRRGGRQAIRICPAATAEAEPEAAHRIGWVDGLLDELAPGAAWTARIPVLGWLEGRRVGPVMLRTWRALFAALPGRLAALERAAG